MFETTIKSLKVDVHELEQELAGIEARRKEVKKKIRQANGVLKKLNGPEPTLKALNEAPSAERPTSSKPSGAA